MPLTSLTKLQGASFGNVTATSITSPSYSVSLTAGETLAALDAVYLEPTLTQGTAGRVYKMDADVLVKSTQAFFVGFASAAASAAANVNIQISGVVSGFSGLTTGAIYYADRTAGAITNGINRVSMFGTSSSSSAGGAVALSLSPATGNTISYDATANNGGWGTTKTFSHTTGSGATMLIVTVRDDSNNVTGITFNGVSMTQLTAGPAGYAYGLYVYYLGSPSIGTYNIVVSSASTNIGAVSTSYKGTTTTPYASNTVSKTSGTAIGVSDVAATAGSWGWMTVHDRVGAVPTAGVNSVARADNGAAASFAVFDTNGPITTIKPLHPLPVGIAISATQLLINTRKREQEESEHVSAVYGYSFGGNSGAIVATADRITFSTGTTAASTVSNLSGIRYGGAGVSDTTVYGYTMGGWSGATVATTDRVFFATSATAASTISNLSGVRYSSSGVSDGAIYGYAMGGDSTGSSAFVTTTDRITFTTSITIASTVSNVSQARGYFLPVSDAAVYGYVMGGNTGAAVSTGDRITFSNSATAASTVSNLSQARHQGCGLSDGVTYGYALGGYTGAGVVTTDRITFSTSVTAASTANNLSQARYAVTAGASDGVTYGYSLGGYTGAYVATTDRTTFSSSTTAAFTAANLSTIRGYSIGLSDGAV